MFDNTQEISGFEYHNDVKCYCPLGADWYCASVDITAENLKTLPDYNDLDEHIRSLDGQSLLLEDVCLDVFLFVEEQTKGDRLRVEVYTDNATHAPVKVYKER